MRIGQVRCPTFWGWGYAPSIGRFYSHVASRHCYDRRDPRMASRVSSLTLHALRALGCREVECSASPDDQQATLAANLGMLRFPTGHSHPATFVENSRLSSFRFIGLGFDGGL